MCGILGHFSTSPITQLDWLRRGSEAMDHRGPDDQGEWCSIDGRVAFAHRRLSIVDLSPFGRQPMHSQSGLLSIVFNGEIYNYQELRSVLQSKGYSFQSNTDTEVVLASYQEWGSECLKHLNGMFALAIYDATKQTGFLARDRAGEKPLFLYQAKGELRFSSELKSILSDSRVKRSVEPRALDCYLAMGYVPGDLCLLQGFTKLPPGHAMLFDVRTGEIERWCYWQLPKPHSMGVGESSELALVNELEDLLEDSVSRQLMADVPVGVLLSGGIDSSLIAALAARNTGPIQTFTIGFPGNTRLDETKHAQLISSHFCTQHTELMAEDASADLLPELARQFDEPIADSSMIPTYLVSKLVRNHCKVALGGDGGDELFGGYKHYSRLQWMYKNLDFVPNALKRHVAIAAEKYLPIGFRGRNYLQGISSNLKNELPTFGTIFDITSRKRLLCSNSGWPYEAESIFIDRLPRTNDLIERATRMDFENYLTDDILVKVDRSSMLNSLEVRAPFLDYRVIEFAFGKVPTHLKSTIRDRKILLKRLASRVLPPEFEFDRKQGFSVPLKEWLKSGPYRKLFNEVLRDPQCTFNAATIDRLLRGQDKGHSNSERLFSLVIFELWRHEYGVSV